MEHPHPNHFTTNRERRHSDPPTSRSEQVSIPSIRPGPLSSSAAYAFTQGHPDFHNTQVLGPAPDLKPIYAVSDEMKAMVYRQDQGQEPSVDEQLQTGNQPAINSIEELNSLMQGCHVNNGNDTAHNRAFLRRFKIPRLDWSLELIATARQTGDFYHLARISVIFEKFEFHLPQQPA
ncbi:hypothetical protein TWF730_004015 [Orbilia blumenaviensis]|uniref:Uncharacterized protein n=1 Tax=Orbilia blumenaviensis TaxID=1796055 RepID=A0AAV9U1I5_9PEZI